MLSGLPPVPNLLGLLWWFCGVLTFQSREFPPLAAEPPTRLLPRLSDIPKEEAGIRQEYWGSIFLASPVVMALICEGMRHLFRRVAQPVGEFAGNGAYEGIQQGQAVQRKSEFSRPAVVACVSYHVFCAGLVATAIPNDWISTKGGGSFAWELWAIWQQVCLWNLFIQNFVRCVMMDAEALRASTFKTVMMSTMPLVSELTDTMKDWVVAGVCFTLGASPSLALVACVVIMAELALACVHVAPRKAISESISVALPLWLPAGMLAVTSIVFLVVVMHPSHPSVLALWIFYAVAMLPVYTTMFCLLLPFSILSSGKLGWVDPPGWDFVFSQSLDSFQECLIVTDGYILAIASVYVIVYSYAQAFQYEGLMSELKRIFFGILELTPPKTSASFERLSGWMARELDILLGDQLSDTRLLIAWVEDWPQALLGVALVGRYILPEEGVSCVGFAGLSVAISAAKAVLIPLLREAAYWWQLTTILATLKELVGSKEALQDLANKLGVGVGAASAPLHRSESVQMLKALLSEHVDVVLGSCGVHEHYLYHPIIKHCSDWLENYIDTDSFYVTKHLAEALLERGITREAFFDHGFGIELGKTPEECRRAGYSCRQCRLAKVGGKELKEAGFSCKEFQNAGFSALDCIKAGWEARELRSAGFTEEEVEDAMRTRVSKFPPGPHWWLNNVNVFDTY